VSADFGLDQSQRSTLIVAKKPYPSALGGDLNWSTQHFNLIVKRWSVDYESQSSNKVYNSTEE
jgi:hypothetical protein